MKKTLLLAFLLILLTSAYKVSAAYNGYIVKFTAGYVPPREYELKLINEKNNIYYTEKCDFSNSVQNHIEHIEQNSKVDLIEGIEPVTLRGMPRNESYSEQWQLQMINADSAWQLETYGNNVRVAVIDSGCYQHEDLKGNLLEGKNYIDNSNDVTDNNGHGTHICGIIAAEMNDIGITGVAPKAKIVPLKCFDPSDDTHIDALIRAIYDAVDVYHCQVINMSWGMKQNDLMLQEAIDYACENGVFCIAAVGNLGSDAVYYPAAYKNVIGVGSVGLEKRKSAFSQCNQSVFVVAPGESVKSTYNNGGYALLSGTSQATPFVSGLAATLLSIEENLSFDEFKQILAKTSEDLGDEYYDTEYGYGLINQDLSIKKVLENIKYYVSPINIDSDEAYVLIKNNTEDNLDAVSIFATYESNRMMKFKLTPIEVMPNSELIVKVKNHKNALSHFLWDSLDSMQPILCKRIK